MKNINEIVVKNDLSEFESIYQYVQKFFKDNSIDPKLFYDVVLCLEELFTNIVSYAYDDKNEHLVQFYFEIYDSFITITIEDDGKEFDVTSVIDPNLDLPIEERPIGGLGIFFVRKIMDSMKYLRYDGKNRLDLKKSIKK